MKIILGGIIGAMIDEASVKDDANSLEYPSFSISGTMILLIIAACAFADPKIEAKNMLAMTVT
jgi:hypothetical protein